MAQKLNYVKLTRPLNAVAAGTSVQNGTGVDTQDYEGVLFIAALGALSATQVTSLKAQSSFDDAATDPYADITGAATAAAADADSNKLLVLDVYRPQERYVRPVVLRATANAVIDGVVAVLYGAKKVPVSQSATFVSQSKAQVG